MFHPLHMIHYYRHLTVATRVGPPVVVDVHRYKCRNLRFGGTVAAEGFKNAIIRAKREHPDPNDARDIELAHTFTGKGYPDEISRSLTTVLRLHRYDASLGIGPGLQRICDQHIGLDCNGFAGNFAKKAHLTHSHDPADRAPRDWGEEPYRRRAINDVQANDVLVWTSGIHMAVVEGHALSLPNSYTAGHLESRW